MQRPKVFRFLFLFFLTIFFSLQITASPSLAASGLTCATGQEGQTAGEYDSQVCGKVCVKAKAGNCNTNEVCDSKYTNSDDKPCALVDKTVLNCTCKDAVNFTCGTNGSTNDFTRSCGSGQACSNSVLSDSNHNSPWPCATNVNSSNAPTGTLYNPCPNGICDTSLGPITISNPSAFVSKIFQILLSISGIVALLLIITSGYQLMMSQGNPEKVKGARERLTAAIVGLLFIIFSVAILQIVGVDILHIPGFR